MMLMRRSFVRQHTPMDATIQQIQEAMALSYPVQLSGRKRASVALLLRRGGGGLEVFFIKRTTRTGDRWSGDVALPGGKQEPGETELQAAMREVAEEVGLDLQQLPWECLGHIDDRRALELTVRCYVFLLPSEHRPAIALQTSEVAACGWCPLQHLCRPTSEVQVTATWPNSRFINSGAMRAMNWLMLPRMLSLHRFCFNAVDLPVDAEPPSSGDFRLWGLTLGMVNDFLLLSGLRPRSDPFTVYPVWKCCGVRMDHGVCDSLVQNLACKSLQMCIRTFYDEKFSPVKAALLLYYIEASAVVTASCFMALLGLRSIPSGLVCRQGR